MKRFRHLLVWAPLGGIIVALLLGAGLFHSAGRYFSSELQANLKWVSASTFREESRATSDLFKQALKHDVVSFNPSVPAFQVRPCESLHDAGLQGGATTSAGRIALAILCESGNGREVLSQIEAWNGSFVLLGVRDDRDDRPVCDDGQPMPSGVVRAGCRKNQWTASSLDTASRSETPVPVIEGGVPPPEDFADLASYRTSWMSDWATFGPFAAAGQRVGLRTRATIDREGLSIDLIGMPRSVTINGATVQVNAALETQTLPLGEHRVSLELTCNATSVDNDCTRAAGQSLPLAWRISIARATPGLASIEIEAEPILSIPSRTRRLLGIGVSPRDDEQALRRSPHIAANCAREKGELTCEPSWEASARETSNKRPERAELVLADGSAVLAPDGRLSPLVEQLGLVPIIGFGPEDRGSLVRAASRVQTPRSLRLTIEPAMQRMVQDQLDSVLRDRALRRLGRAERARLAQEDIEGLQGDDQGKASIVIMDAGDRAGEVLAMVSWPRFRSGLSAWDVASLNSGSEHASPLAGIGWRAGNVDTMPGSTFKLVTAFAAGRAMADPKVRGAFTGQMSINEQARELGVGSPASTVLEVDGYPIRNAGGSPFGRINMAAAETGCPRATAAALQAGVCEALIRSSNHWFAGMALLLDRPRVLRPASGGAASRGTQLADAARILYPIEEPDADEAKRAAMAAQLDLTRGLLPEATRLRAEPMQLTVGLPGSGLIALATNAYGQGVRASPLAMASIYASFGKGSVVRPRIVASDPRNPETPMNGEGVPLGLGLPEADGRLMLAGLRAGLRGVANSDAGTAKPYISRDAPESVRRRIYSKTGTADTVDGLNSAWYAGWIEPEQPGGRRLAFACMISRVRDKGGTLCAPLMGKILLRLGAMERHP